MAAELSDQAWANIAAAAEPFVPDAEARALLSAILFDEYPAFHYDRERWATVKKGAERMLKYLAAFEHEYRATQLQPADHIRTEADLYWIKMLRRTPQHAWNVASAVIWANEGRKNEQRAWLYSKLCEVWLDHFHGELKYSRYPDDGSSRARKPYGELINFIRACMRQIMPDDALPADETITDAIDRERKRYEHFWKEVIERLHKEMQEDLDRRQRKTLKP